MEEINKTIVVTYDEVTRMKDFCTNKEEGVTRDFMDWYVNDNAFFSQKGMLICEDVIKHSNKKFVVSFDFGNPDYPEFCLYDYAKQKPVCRYVFIREDNLTMKDISIKTNWVDYKFFRDADSVFISNEIAEEHKPKLEDRVEDKLDYSKMDVRQLKKHENRILNKIQYHKQRKKAVEKQLEKLTYDIAVFMATQGVYFCYATMYYFAKNKAKEIVGTPKNQLIENGVGKQISATYKYTGYVNINDAKIYKPEIKKEKSEPKREYGRHIEKWSVRGHYRRVNGKIIWIESFEKGEGELEKRVYGTEKESEVNLIPKVFEAKRTVYKDEPKEYQTNKPEPPKTENLIIPQKEASFNSKSSWWAKFVSFFTSNKTYTQ